MEISESSSGYCPPDVSFLVDCLQDVKSPVLPADFSPPPSRLIGTEFINKSTDVSDASFKRETNTDQ